MEPWYKLGAKRRWKSYRKNTRKKVYKQTRLNEHQSAIKARANRNITVTLGIALKTVYVSSRHWSGYLIEFISLLFESARNHWPCRHVSSFTFRPGSINLLWFASKNEWFIYREYLLVQNNTGCVKTSGLLFRQISRRYLRRVNLKRLDACGVECRVQLKRWKFKYVNVETPVKYRSTCILKRMLSSVS